MSNKEQKNIYDDFENGWGEIPPSNVPIKITLDKDRAVNDNLKAISKERWLWNLISKMRQKGNHVGISRTVSGGITVIASPQKEALGKPEREFMPLKPRTVR